MIIEYNFKYNNNINKTYLQSKMCDLFAKKQQLLLSLLRLVKIIIVHSVIIVHSELIKWSSVDPYTRFKRISMKWQAAGVFKK
jgi:hypothetical protein